MSIILHSGIPGAGKSHRLVKMIRDELIPTGRNVVANIEGLKLPGVDVISQDDDAPMRWQDYPDGTIFVFDEIWKWWGSDLSPTKMPEAIKQLRVHRHRGFDFHIITQDPSDLTKRVRTLIQEHHHQRRILGSGRIRVDRYHGINEEPAKDVKAEDSDPSFYHLDPSIFPLYKSATQHTMRRRIPRKLVLAISGASIFLAGMVWMMFANFGPGSEFYASLTSLSDPPEVLSVERVPSVCLPVLSWAPLTVRVSGQLRVLDPSPAVHVRRVGSTYEVCA